MKKLMIASAMLLGACSSGTSTGELANAPDWYIDPPVEKNNVYTAGFAKDTNLQFAMEVAELSAKRTLASQISSVINGRSRYYRGASGKNLSEIAAVETIDDVDVSGYKREKVEIVETVGGYSVYMMLIYPLSNLSHEPKIFEDIGQ